MGIYSLLQHVFPYNRLLYEFSVYTGLIIGVNLSFDLIESLMQRQSYLLCWQGSLVGHIQASAGMAIGFLLADGLIAL